MSYNLLDHEPDCITETRLNKKTVFGLRKSVQIYMGTQKTVKFHIMQLHKLHVAKRNGCNLFYFNCGSALLTHKVLGTVNFRTRLHTLNSEGWCSIQKDVLKIFREKHMCQRLFLRKVAGQCLQLY